MKLMVAAAALLVLVAGCGGGSDDEPKAKSKPTTSPSATESRAPVSILTACQILIPDEGTGPLGDIADLINADSPDSSDLQRANDALDTLKQLEPVAPSPLREQLLAHDRIVQGYLDELNANGTADLELTQYKAAGIEISNLCLGAYGG